MARATIKLVRQGFSQIEVYCRDCDYHEDSDPKLATYHAGGPAEARKQARKIGLVHALGTDHEVKVVKARYYRLYVEPANAAEAKAQLEAEDEELFGPLT
jgi:hypothetical protein